MIFLIFMFFFYINLNSAKLCSYFKAKIISMPKKYLFPGCKINCVSLIFQRFTKQCMMCTEKHILVKIVSRKWAEHITPCPSQKWSKDEEKIFGFPVSKDSHPDSLLGYKRTHHY